MIKNLVIAALSCALIALVIAHADQSHRNKDLALRLRNTELNLQYEKALE